MAVPSTLASILPPPSIAAFLSKTPRSISASSPTRIRSGAGGSLSIRRFGAKQAMLTTLERRLRGPVCYASPTAAISPPTLQWISAVSSAVLMFSQGTAIHKSFLVPLFALQAPAAVISWIKGEYGIWTAFLMLLVRLFYFLPGELDRPFLTMLLVLIAPYEALGLRGTQAGAAISLVIAAYLAYQHFSRAGSLRRAFSEGSIIPTLAIICTTIVPCFFLF